MHHYHRITNQKKKKKKKVSLLIINVCIDRRTEWKTGIHAKFVILLKYRNYYYYIIFIYTDLLYLKKLQVNVKLTAIYLFIYLFIIIEVDSICLKDIQ